MIVIRQERNCSSDVQIYGMRYNHYEKIFGYMHDIKVGGNYGSQLRFSIYDACNKYAKELLGHYIVPLHLNAAESIVINIAGQLEMPLPIRLSTCKVTYKRPLEANLTDMLYKHIRWLIQGEYIRIALDSNEDHIRHTLITISDVINVQQAMGNFATAAMLGNEARVDSILTDYVNAGIDITECVTPAFGRSLSLYDIKDMSAMPLARWAIPVLEDYGVWMGCDNGLVPYNFTTDEEAEDVYEVAHVISSVTKSQATNFNR